MYNLCFLCVDWEGLRIGENMSIYILKKITPLYIYMINGKDEVT
jgi:hypothetical protein